MDKRDHSCEAKKLREARSQSGASLEEELSIAAELAYLDLSELERRAFAESVGRMLEFFATMDGFPAQREVPYEGRGEAVPRGANRLRPDRRVPFLGADLIEAAAQREEHLVSIPNIL